MTEQITVRKDQILWQTPKMVIFRDDDGFWRYMPEFKTRWPVSFEDIGPGRDCEVSWDEI